MHGIGFWGPGELGAGAGTPSPNGLITERFRSSTGRGGGIRVALPARSIFTCTSILPYAFGCSLTTTYSVQCDQHPKGATPAPAVESKIPFQRQNILRIQLIGEVDQAGISKIGWQASAPAHDVSNGSGGAGELKRNLKDSSLDILKHCFRRTGRSMQQIATLRNCRLAGHQRPFQAIHGNHTRRVASLLTRRATTTPVSTSTGFNAQTLGGVSYSIQDRECPSRTSPRRSLVWPGSQHNMRRAGAHPHEPRGTGSSRADSPVAPERPGTVDQAAPAHSAP